MTPINYCLEFIKMELKNILFIGLIISSCGGGSSANPQASSVTPAQASEPSPPSTAITSDLVAQAKGTIAGKISFHLTATS